MGASVTGPSSSAATVAGAGAAAPPPVRTEVTGPGLQGSQGGPGPQGTTGSAGPQGGQGVQGAAGAQGGQGAQGGTGAQGESMTPAGAGTELQYRNGATLGAVGGTSVSGHVVTLTAEDGTNQRVLVLNGDYPRIHLQGDGTEHFVDASHIQGISFGNNYYFGIGANLESAAGAAILVQANGSVIIPNIQFGYIGPVGGGAADTFGRVEGQKIALQFGTEGQYGLRIFDQFGGHPQYLGTMLVESAKADGPVFVVRARADQTSPLVEAQASTGATLVRVTAGGDVEVTTPGRGVVLTSPDGTHYRLGVSNAGTAVFTALP